MLGSTPYLLNSATRTTDFSPLPSTTGYSWKAVKMSAQQVRVPSTKRKTFVACTQNHPSAEERLTTWKVRLTNMRAQPVTLGEFIGREGSYFLSRKKGEQEILSFEEPILSLTRGHILGEKPPSRRYLPHPSEVSPLKDAEELHLTDFAKIATGFEGYIFPPTLNRSAIANLLVDSTPGGMMRAVVTCLLAIGVLPKAPAIPPDREQEGLSCEAFDVRNIDGTTDETPIREELYNPTTESNLTPIIALVVTQKGKRRMIHPPTPQESRQPPHTVPSGEMPPPPTPVTPPPRTRTRKQKDHGTTDPMLPTQETTTSVETALSQGEHRGPYPTMVQRIAGLLRKPQELMKRQREDSNLLGKIQDLDNGETGGEYVTDDDGLLWYAPPGFILCLAIPRSLAPGILALVHTTYGHPGVARTTELTQRKYHWTSLKGDVRDYVLSCGCRRLKRSNSQRVAMLPARFFKPWEVLEMDIHDMGARFEAGNKHTVSLL